MSKHGDRVGRIERRKRRGSMLILHKFPGETRDQVVAAHERVHGPIPEKTRVIIIGHTFRSAI